MSEPNRFSKFNAFAARVSEESERLHREQERKAFEMFLPKPEPLDSIDLAYLQLEQPLLVCRVPRESTMAQRSRLLRELEKLTRYPVAILPAGYELELLGGEPPRPFELARWADDGGRV